MRSFLLLILAFPFFTVSATADEKTSPEARALAFLMREVPRWSAENKCYSCHNNGDAARALYQALQLKLAIPPKALEDTTQWLARPAGWDRNGGDNAPQDRGLARVMFAAALLEARAAGQLKDPDALRKAAEVVAEQQKAEGCWRPDGEDTIGSPAACGALLMTYQARRVLQQADPRRYREALARADRWLRQVPVRTVIDAAALLLALAGSDDATAKERRQHCLDLIRKGEAKEGGWGPYVHSSPEPFDTAVVLLALKPLQEEKDVPAMLRRGRAYLIANQQKDGSWIETTRPAGAESYAQRLSTAGWATLALLATAPKP